PSPSTTLFRSAVRAAHRRRPHRGRQGLTHEAARSPTAPPPPTQGCTRGRPLQVGRNSMTELPVALRAVPEVSERVRELHARMTLEEKLAQLVGYWLDQGGNVVAPMQG